MASKTILVTGCSAGGIGATIALALARRSHHVFATARTVSKIPEELSSLSNVTVLALDTTSAESVAAVATAVETSDHPQLDVLVNNAGVGYTIPVLDVDIDTARHVFDVNVFGVVRMVQGFSDLLIRSKGRIVNMSTSGTVVNTPWIAAYTASKTALTSFSETMRLELEPFGVTVVTIMAGTINTHFHDNEPTFQMPETSRYAAIKDLIVGWANGKLKPPGIAPEPFVEPIVGDIVGPGKGGVYWRGPWTGVIKILSEWSPQWCNDAILKSDGIGLGFKELAQHLSGAERK
ncbi:NAD(P)-binding protein [Apiospora rasikravindrae]|uniref:NAD(P)-binding protein n=1 Tax=Apiospora rasikravindrae TaxID=990691 RepID=A0ABR1U2Z7_9PEZI